MNNTNKFWDVIEVDTYQTPNVRHVITTIYATEEKALQVQQLLSEVCGNSEWEILIEEN